MVAIMLMMKVLMLIAKITTIRVTTAMVTFTTRVLKSQEEESYIE